MKRRDFLKVAGFMVAGAAIRPVHGLVTGSSLAETLKPDRRSSKWAMAVDLKACARGADCRDCIDACHRVHNVPVLSARKESLKWIEKAPFERVFEEFTHPLMDRAQRERPALILCNHCENPPCVKVCPTKATWKREDGIVMMDYHRCIGCRYCMAACPFGARSFNWRDPRLFLGDIALDFPTRTKGVVEKCNFCEERLTGGRLPACVEACKEKSLVFGDMNDQGGALAKSLAGRQVIRRKGHLGTEPKVYYLL
jgi:Fe-S-cluster-containing dehydrogenase component